MRTSQWIDQTWKSGYAFVGDRKPCTRVTVEPGWMLRRTHGNLGTWPDDKKALRYYQLCDNGQPEREIPNIKRVESDRSLDTDAATCDIVIDNTVMKTNLGSQVDLNVLGNPGYFTPTRGTTVTGISRWKTQRVPEWVNMLTPNALIRVYQGYGGHDMTIEQATSLQRIILNGVWLVDKVNISSNGEITLQCRDMAKLLLVQQLYPPTVPDAQYPLRYARWKYRIENRTNRRLVAAAGPRRCVFDTSANFAWYESGAVHGHHPADAFDNNPDTYYLSVGNSSPDEPFAVEWVQGDVGDYIDYVDVHPYMGNYICYVSIMENGVWQDVVGTIPYNPESVGRYGPGPYQASIPAVARVGIPWETNSRVTLPRAYRADKVRITLTNLAKSQWGPFFYRGAVREIRVGLANEIAESSTTTAEVREDGNYRDFTDIVKDLLLWAGFLCKEPNVIGSPKVYGNLEYTGTYAEDTLPDEMFDKRPVMDAITGIKELVGFNFFIDEEGAAQFTSGNWWGPGNFYTNGIRTESIPHIDERRNLLDYSVQLSDEASRSEIVITPDYHYSRGKNNPGYYRHPSIYQYLKGIDKIALWTNAPLEGPELKTMAELIAMQIFFQQRQAQATIPANPNLTLDTQVRIFERVTNETHIHYIRGIRTIHDLQSGEFTQTLTTHQLTGPDGWLIATFGRMSRDFII